MSAGSPSNAADHEALNYHGHRLGSAQRRYPIIGDANGEEVGAGWLAGRDEPGEGAIGGVDNGPGRRPRFEAEGQGLRRRVRIRGRGHEGQQVARPRALIRHGRQHGRGIGELIRRFWRGEGHEIDGRAAVGPPALAHVRLLRTIVNRIHQVTQGIKEANRTAGLGQLEIGMQIIARAAQSPIGPDQYEPIRR